MNEIRTAVNLVPIIVVKNGVKLSYTFTRSNPNAIVVFNLSAPIYTGLNRHFFFNGERITDSSRFINDGNINGWQPTYIKLSVKKGDTIQWVTETNVQSGWVIIY